MAKTSKDVKPVNEDTREKILMSKAMLYKYGALTPFHAKQLELLPLVSHPMAIHSVAVVDGIEKAVEYYIFTKRNYTYENKILSKLEQWAPLAIINKMMSFFSHKEMEADSKRRLTEWTPEFMWPNTKVTVYIDKDVPPMNDEDESI